MIRNRHDFKKARKLLGLTQSGLARLLGWTSSRQVSNIETGARLLNRQTRLAVESLLRRADLWETFQGGDE